MHSPDLISEAPTVFGERTYTARRNATPEPDGSWRWQVFADNEPGPVGYLQSHTCEDYAREPRLLVFDRANRPVGTPKRSDHDCVLAYINALLYLREAEAGRA